NTDVSLSAVSLATAPDMATASKQNSKTNGKTNGSSVVLVRCRVVFIISPCVNKHRSPRNSCCTRNGGVLKSSWTYQGITAFGQLQNAGHASTNRNHVRVQIRLFTSFPYDGVDCIHAAIKTHTLLRQAVHQLDILI